MNGKWYYSHDGVTHGPFSNREIMEHAARKMLLENDWVWQGSREPKDAFPAQAALDFSNLPLVASPIPDWLEDVAKGESKSPLPALLASKEAPNWLEDLRLWVGLELCVGAKASLNSSASAIITDGIPDWLDSWITKKKPKDPKTELISAPIVPPGGLGLIPPSKTMGPPSGPSFTPAAQRHVPPVQEQHEKTKPTGTAEDVLTDKTIQEMGFNPKTGQILDPERFRKWQKSFNSQQPTVTNESLFEGFRKARIAIENWVDEDSRRPLVMAGDLDAIKKEVTLLAIFQKTQGYGSTMQEKLWHHLEFMVENRRKYYTACSA